MVISVNSMRRLWAHPAPLRPSFGALRYQRSELLVCVEGIGAPPPLVKGVTNHIRIKLVTSAVFVL